ncbi:MAG: hypothetical protein O3A00_01315 [Planctomycetota bacterium]|nr:hypothetical protein [Planctomycetota bacterium]
MGRPEKWLGWIGVAWNDQQHRVSTPGDNRDASLRPAPIKKRRAYSKNT